MLLVLHILVLTPHPHLYHLVSQEVPLLSKHIPVLVQFFLECSANKAYDDELRIMALNALSWMVK